jgi:hypothetical protein
MPTWVVARNNRNAWTNISVAALTNSFAQYGVILDVNVFDNGAKASILFESNSDAERFVDEMTFSYHGPLFIPGLPYGCRLGAHVRQSRHRAVSCGFFYFYFLIFLNLILLNFLFFLRLVDAEEVVDEKEAQKAQKVVVKEVTHPVAAGPLWPEPKEVRESESL